MGDRASISFQNGTEESVALFSHWGGREFQDKAVKYLMELDRERQNKDKNGVNPLYRFEPATMIVDFIRWLCKDEGIERVESNLYLGKDSEDGDNSDNGHLCINVGDYTK